MRFSRYVYEYVADYKGDYKVARSAEGYAIVKRPVGGWHPRFGPTKGWNWWLRAPDGRGLGIFTKFSEAKQAAEWAAGKEAKA